MRLQDDEGEFCVRIVVHTCGESPDECLLPACVDPNCKEWPVVEVLDALHQPTGQRIFHISECAMEDARPIKREQLKSI